MPLPPDPGVASRGMSLLERRFQIRERGSTVRTEVLGGLVTFLTMAYIVVVNPAILSAADMPVAAVTVATALGAALFTLIMGLATNLPFALAAGLGINAVVAFQIVGPGVPWQVGMACVVIEGVIAIVLVLAGLREAIMRAIPHEIKLSIGVGIGLFITLVGLRDAGITINNPATGISLGDVTAGPPLIALAGLLTMIVLSARNVKGSILIGIAVSTVLGLIFGVLEPPESYAPSIPNSSDFSTIGDALHPDNLIDALTWALVPLIFVLFVTDFFDTIGTAVAVSSAGGMLDENGQPPRLKRLLLVDSFAAAGGGVLGTSSNTTYVESGAGVAEGARTGLASVVTAGCFLLTIFFVPLIAVVAQTVIVGEAQLHPAIAPALIMIGYLMIRLVADIDWSRPEAGIPAFFVIAGVPLMFSIAGGIGLGVLSYVAVMVGTGRARQVHPLMWAMVPLFACFFASNWLTENIF